MAEKFFIFCFRCLGGAVICIGYVLLLLIITASPAPPRFITVNEKTIN